MTPYFFTLQSTYNNIDIGLYKGLQLLSCSQESKLMASRNMICIFESQLKENAITLDSISFIVVNRGPAPFTSLRAIIATANALAYAKNIPLIGINALKVMMQRAVQLAPFPIILFNAYNNDCYFAFHNAEKKIELGCKSIIDFLDYIQHFFPTQTPIEFFGNMAVDHAVSIQTIYPHCQINQKYQYPVLHEIAQQGLHYYQLGNAMETQLQPLYLKQFSYKSAL